MYRILISILVLIFASTVYAQESAPEIKLKPQMRAEPLSNAIETIDTEELASYFENIAIFDKEKDFEELPYIVGFDNDANMGATGDIAYSRGLDSPNIAAFTMLAPGEIYKDPDTKEVLGYFAEVIGNTEVQRWGSVQTHTIVNSLTPIDIGTKLVPRIGLDLPSVLEVHEPQTPMSGRVLDVDNDEVGVGHFSVAIISIGERDGARPGDLLYVLEAPTYVRDPNTHKDVLLPSEAFGKLLIYKTYEKVSLAIVVEANKPVKKLDKVAGDSGANVEITKEEIKKPRYQNCGLCSCAK